MASPVRLQTFCARVEFSECCGVGWVEDRAGAGCCCCDVVVGEVFEAGGERGDGGAEGEALGGGHEGVGGVGVVVALHVVVPFVDGFSDEGGVFGCAAFLGFFHHVDTGWS